MITLKHVFQQSKEQKWQEGNITFRYNSRGQGSDASPRLIVQTVDASNHQNITASIMLKTFFSIGWFAVRPALCFREYSIAAIFLGFVGLWV